MNLLYLTHDLSDPMTQRRIAMLQAGGAQVRVAGFRREAAQVAQVHGSMATHFGRTHNGRFAERAFAVLREIVLLKRHRALFVWADVVVARNLEMLAIGVCGRNLAAKKPVLVYECLDIHRLLLNQGMAGHALRILEGRLSSQAAALLTSSPAFVREYFEKCSRVALPVRLVENKVYPALAPSCVPRTEDTPWRIGWFGALRCAKSFSLLELLVRTHPGSIEVVMRGRPALDQLPNFEARVNAAPGMTFLGPYKNLDALATIYSDVHFSWAIDMFEEGLNSAWLLPNRLYEGSLYGAVPIMLQDVEVARYAQQLGIGVTLSEPKDAALMRFFEELTPASYRKLHEALRAVDPSTWQYTPADCAALVDYLGGLR